MSSGEGHDARPPRTTNPSPASGVSSVAGESSDGRMAVRTPCPKCGQPTPGGFAFCQHCGTRMGDGQAHPSTPHPSASVPAIPARSSRSVPPVSSNSRPPAKPRPSGSVAAANEHQPAPPPPDHPVRQSNVPISGVLRGKLILLRRDGSDGETFPMSGETFDIGRTSGNRTFGDDVYMAARHARFLATGGGVRVRAIDHTNGVLVQIREPYELQSGDVFYIGRELLRFELLHNEERDPPPVFEHGVRMFGSTPRESWGRLRQLTTAGTTRDLFHLCRAEVRIGREEGDIVFPDDEFMSRRHAVLTRHGNRIRIEDQHSSNGTYVRLRSDRDLSPGDVLRIGDQVLRFEP